MTSRKLAVLAFALSVPMASCADQGSGNPLLVPADPSMNHACDGSILYFGRYVALSSNPTYTDPEVEGTLGTGCGYMVLTGVGGTIVHDSHYETLWLTGRMLYHDGTWSAPTTRVYGNLNKAQEQYLSVPFGHAIVGLSMGLSGTSDQLTTIRIRHREVQYVNGQLQLVGPVYTLKVGSDPLENDAAHELSATNDREVYVGVGLNAAVERTKVLIAHTGALY
jgi:hypothetical protein